MFSPTTLRKHLDYDPEAGVITWKLPTSCRMKPGNIAGSRDNKGYWRVSFKGKTLSGHRLAWALHFGVWPEKQIDHIDRNPLNNSISNLRDVSGSEKCKNRRHRKPGQIRHGGSGVTQHKNGRWQVQVHDPNAGKAIYCGLFPTKAEALSRAKSIRREMDL